MKTVEELKALRIEAESLNRKLTELTEEELTQVTGGSVRRVEPEIVNDPRDPAE